MQTGVCVRWLRQKSKSKSRKIEVAIFHLSVKTVSRAYGRSATAAAAYRSATEIVDERTGEVHDYRRKTGVVESAVILPEGAPAWARDRAALWNAAEQAEKRKNSTVAREFEIALPAELPGDARAQLARDFAAELAERHGCAVDVCIHEPGHGGDHRNHHAHLLLTTRRLGADGLGEKTRELDDRATGPELVSQWRERFAVMQNERLQAHGLAERVDHRTLEAQRDEAAERGDVVSYARLDRLPQIKMGVTATAMARRGLHTVRFEMALDRQVANDDRLATFAGELATVVNLAEERQRRSQVKPAQGGFDLSVLDRLIAEQDEPIPTPAPTQKPTPKPTRAPRQQRPSGLTIDFEALREIDAAASATRPAAPPPTPAPASRPAPAATTPPAVHPAGETLARHMLDVVQKRSAKAPDWVNGGARWEALPEQLRKQLALLAAAPEAQRRVMIGNLKANSSQNPKEAEKVIQHFKDAEALKVQQRRPDPRRHSSDRDR